jgi:hypothetical protein
MARFSEIAFTGWTNPASLSEETKLENAQRMVRDAIRNDPTLKALSIKIFGQGSYANDTNVRLNSDIDINVCYQDGFYFDLPTGRNRDDFGIEPIVYTFSDYKNDVYNALTNNFGMASVKRNDKCITILANTYRVQTDVVPTWRHRRYSEDKSYIEGVYFITDAGVIKKSFPEQHIINAREKNRRTSKRFKRITRIFRKLRYKMIEEGQPVNSNITSFLIECLLWNVPDHIFNSTLNWTERVKQCIIFLYENTLTDEKCSAWGEVSELLYLLKGHKWSRQDVNSFMHQLWNYLQF